MTAEKEEERGCLPRMGSPPRPQKAPLHGGGRALSVSPSPGRGRSLPSVYPDTHPVQSTAPHAPRGPPETEPRGQAPGTAPRLQAHQVALGGGAPQVSLSLISCSGWELPSVQVSPPKPLPFPSQGAPLQAPRTAAALTSLRAARGPRTAAASERQRDQMKPARE